MSEAIYPYQVRWAYPEEWKPSMEVVWKTFLKFEGDVYSKEGIRNFYEFITDKELLDSFLKGDYEMLVALDDEQIIGVASVRNGNYLSLLFVDERYHYQGVGRQLMQTMCEYLKQEKGERYMTLKASPYAVAFYEKLGFWATGPEERYAGIQVTPMEKLL